MIGDEAFECIWGTGVLQQINAACGTNISDYEEVEVSAECVGDALRVMQRLSLSAPASPFCADLVALLSNAASDGRSVYFVF